MQDLPVVRGRSSRERERESVNDWSMIYMGVPLCSGVGGGALTGQPNEHMLVCVYPPPITHTYIHIYNTRKCTYTLYSETTRLANVLSNTLFTFYISS